MAEADGNRTRQAEILDLVGFEDRDAHQDAYASEVDVSETVPMRAGRLPYLDYGIRNTGLLHLRCTATGETRSNQLNVSIYAAANRIVDTK